MNGETARRSLVAGIGGDRPHASRVAWALLLSWLGLYLHNLRELALPLWRPENSVLLVIGVLLAVAWWRYPSRWVGVVLVVYVALQLIGGAVVSVLPLGIFPFEPDQTLSHYAAHVVYGLLQIPLAITSWRALTRTRNRRRPVRE